nr:MAG TPA_asm: hypothetical protein [Caudoviricetes sp.]
MYLFATNFTSPHVPFWFKRRPPSRPLFRQFGNPLLRQRRETLEEAKDAA